MRAARMGGSSLDQPPCYGTSGELHMKNFARMAALAAAATLVAAPAVAAPVAASPTAKARARIVKPLTLTANRDLQFGTIVNGLAAGGTRLISVDQTGARSGCDATVVVCGGATPTSAQYTVTGTNQMTVQVATSATNLRNTTSGGNELLPFTYDAPATVALGNSGASGVQFTVGGSFTIADTTVGGDYVGDLLVTVDY